MLTIFTTQKPSTGLTAIHQTNAAGSWLRIPGAEVFTLKSATTGPLGLPYVKSLFGIAETAAANDLLVYANADLILLPDIASAMKRASNRFQRFLLVGQRWDIDLDEPLGFAANWKRFLNQRIVNEGQLHSVSGKDWFGWCRPLGLDIPPFVIGRPGWDNKALDMALQEGIPVIDATQCVTAIHPNHGYSDNWLWDEAAQHNRSLCDVPPNKGRISEATWVMFPDRIVRAEEILDSYDGHGSELGRKLQHLPPDEQERMQAIVQYRRRHEIP